MINHPPPVSGEYNRNPNIKALKGRGPIHHGSTVPPFGTAGPKENHVQQRRGLVLKVGGKNSINYTPT